MITVSSASTNIKDILRDLGLTPRGVQIDAIEAGLLDGESILVCSPTGSGKTLVGEMGLLRAVLDGKRGLFVVPLRALASQVADVLQERYEKLNISVGQSTGDYHKDGSELEQLDIIVTTYERADSLLRHRAQILSEIGVLVIDEVHNIADPYRGARLESVILRIKHIMHELQIVALSATVASADDLADWLGCKLIESSERPVPLSCRVLTTDDRTKSIRELVMTTVQANGQAIVFTRTRREAESEAKRLCSDVGRQLTQIERSELDIEANSIEHWGSRLPLEIRPLIHNGVAYHHAGLGSDSRRLIENMFRKGLLRVLCATTTLSAGMDLPARVVIIAGTSSPADYTQMLPTNQVHQMLGRAGRPGMDEKGFGVILSGSRGESREIKRKYFEELTDEVTGHATLTPRFSPVTSSMGAPSELTDQLLIAINFMGEASIQEIQEEIFEESFLAFSHSRNQRSPQRALELGEISAESAIECHGLEETIRAAKAGVLGTVEIRETTDSTIGGMVEENGGRGVTCRFSARSCSSRGTVEGPTCSCGEPISHEGILCHHLVALGMIAAQKNPEGANFVIPLALSETSPSRTLIRLNLVEGSTHGRLRPTSLGKKVNKLYIRINTFRELVAFAPFTEDNSGLLWLTRHLMSIELRRNLDSSFENLIGSLVTTESSIGSIARSLEMPLGDVYSLLDNALWILFSIYVVAEHSGLEDLVERTHSLLSRIQMRLNNEEEEVAGD
ncbi:MAG: DEAD/DEAH box helicase [Candidatus Thorarchaeota archaeon]|nr:MAG: DEAD/DEAH box helicase [Candidatus Thorarchaeota archaeon]